MADTLPKPQNNRPYNKRRIAVRLAQFTIALLFVHTAFLTVLTLMVMLNDDKDFLNSYIHFSTIYMPVLILALSMGSLYIHKTRPGRIALLLSLVHIAIIAAVLFVEI